MTGNANPNEQWRLRQEKRLPIGGERLEHRVRMHLHDERADRFGRIRVVVGRRVRVGSCGRLRPGQREQQVATHSVRVLSGAVVGLQQMERQTFAQRFSERRIARRRCTEWRQ